MRRRAGSAGGIAIGVLMGMGGELHLAIPGLGFIAMLDLCSYVVAIPVLVTQWSRMGRAMRLSIFWGLAWTGAAMLSNLVYFVDGKYWLKCVSLAASSWCIMATTFVLLKDDPIRFMWYLVGAGIGGWIALYHFRNGATEAFAIKGDQVGDGSGIVGLIDKQIYPAVARGLFYGCLLPVCLKLKRFPAIVVLVAALTAGFYLLFHGGSRSGFGQFCVSAGVGFVVAYMTPFFRRLAKNRIALLSMAALGLCVVFGGYKYLAASGRMGDDEKRKMENEFGVEGKGVLNYRAGFGGAFEQAAESCGIGLGGHLRCHSVMANALACEGFVGFLFWGYFFWMVLWFVSRRLAYSGKNSTFITLMILLAAWDVFGSPFSTRHKFFVLMAFIALCRDNCCYGIGSIFDPRMLGRISYNRMVWRP